MAAFSLEYPDFARLRRADVQPAAIADKRRIDPRQLQLLIEALPDAFLAVESPSPLHRTC